MNGVSVTARQYLFSSRSGNRCRGCCRNLRYLQASDRSPLLMRLCRECRKQRMAVGKPDSALSKRVKSRHILHIHRSTAQAVGDKDDYIATRRRLPKRQSDNCRKAKNAGYFHIKISDPNKAFRQPSASDNCEARTPRTPRAPGSPRTEGNGAPGTPGALGTKRRERTGTPGAPGTENG